MRFASRLFPAVLACLLQAVTAAGQEAEGTKAPAGSAKDGELDPVTRESPDHHWFAAARRIPCDDWIWRSDSDGFRLVVFAKDEEGHLGDEAWAKAERGSRQVTGFEWSPDSKFIVITTASSGGHSPYHLKTFVFCMGDKTLRYLDDAIEETVAAEEIKFEAPDTVILQVLDRTEGHEDLDETRPVKVSLHELVEKMPVEWPLKAPASPPVPEPADK